MQTKARSTGREEEERIEGTLDELRPKCQRLRRAVHTRAQFKYAQILNNKNSTVQWSARTGSIVACRIRCSKQGSDSDFLCLGPTCYGPLDRLYGAVVLRVRY